MTKEQEVVEKVNRIRIDFFDSKYKDVHTDDELEEKYEALGDILNMLKEKDAKIEHLEEKRNNQKAELAILNEKQKEMNKLINTAKSYKGQIKRLEHTNKSYKGIINKKDKQIDLMAEEINETDRGYIDYCQFKMVCDRNCKDCIKQYFERKSEE